MRRKRFFCAELYRYFAQPVFWVTIISAAFLRAIECYYLGRPFGIQEYLKINESVSAVCVMSIESSEGFLYYIALCLCIVLPAALYAEDYQNSVLISRIQKMGKVRYTYIRIIQAGIGAFAAMIFANWICTFIIAVPFKQKWLIGSNGIFSWTGNSTLLDSGRIFTYWGCMVCREGLEAAFYSIITVGISVFLKNRFALVAVPVILKYLASYATWEAPVFIECLFPKYVYGAFNEEGMALGISEIHVLLFQIVYTCAAGMLVGIVLYWQINKENG